MMEKEKDEEDDIEGGRGTACHITNITETLREL
jgi:hypothetical protein